MKVFISSFLFSFSFLFFPNHRPKKRKEYEFILGQSLVKDVRIRDVLTSLNSVFTSSHLVTTMDKPPEPVMSCLTPNYCRLVKQSLLFDCGALDLVLLEFDSLLLFLLSNEYLDWKSGGQYLHLFYNLEELLFQFKERQCRVQIVCFQCHESFWKSPSVLVARYARFSHLYTFLKKIDMFSLFQANLSSFISQRSGLLSKSLTLGGRNNGTHILMTPNRLYSSLNLKNQIWMFSLTTNRIFSMRSFFTTRFPVR